MPKINFITDFVFKILNFKAFWRTILPDMGIDGQY